MIFLLLYFRRRKQDGRRRGGSEEKIQEIWFSRHHRKFWSQQRYAQGWYVHAYVLLLRFILVLEIFVKFLVSWANPSSPCFSHIFPSTFVSPSLLSFLSSHLHFIHCSIFIFPFSSTPLLSLSLSLSQPWKWRLAWHSKINSSQVCAYLYTRLLPFLLSLNPSFL